MQPDKTILALDVGHTRIGVARANIIARISESLTTIDNDSNTSDAIVDLIKKHGAVILVVGLPRGLQGQETDQTNYTKEFVKTIQTNVSIPIVLQDEALSSVEAEEQLARSGKKHDKSTVDAVAAAAILDRFLEANRGNLNRFYE